MLLQKTFHIGLPASEARERLSRLNSYRRVLEGVNRLVKSADGVTQVEFDTGQGFKGEMHLSEVSGGDSDQMLFRSHGGNIEVTGVVEYYPIRQNLTEVVLTVDYTIKSPLYRMLDRATPFIEGYLDQQLRQVRRHFRTLLPASMHLPVDSLHAAA